MINQSRKVDFNAYITELMWNLDYNSDNEALVHISFKNLDKGVLSAIKFKMTAKDSFGDDIIFSDSKFLEVKRAGLNVKPRNKAGITIELGKFDIKKLDLSVVQFVYDDEVCTPVNPDTIEYEIEALENNEEEKEMLDIMKLNNTSAICFPNLHEKGWICSCGHLNSNVKEKCQYCFGDKKTIFEKNSKEEVELEIERRTERKRQQAAQAEEKRRLEEEQKRIEDQRRIEQEKEQEKIKNKKMVRNTIIAIAIIVIALLSVWGVNLYNKKVYGLNEEDKKQYDLAMSNYYKIEGFIIAVDLAYNDEAKKYKADYGTPSRLSKAEKDKDYLYARGMYIASNKLLALNKDCFPEKYKKIYKDYIEMEASENYLDCVCVEGLYVSENMYDSLWDKKKDIGDAKYEAKKYLDEEILNPDKVNYVIPYLQKVDYSKVYGINLGIMYYSDGSIWYVGEIKNNKANGYGIAYMPNGDRIAEGTFEDGFVTKGAKNKECIEGEYIGVDGLTNTQSSESVAKKAQSDEQADINKAANKCDAYLNDVLKKQKGIDSIQWIKVPSVSGSEYTFSCTVFFTDGSQKKGKVYVKKSYDGTFEVEYLLYD